MLETREMSTDAETERCNQLTSGFLFLAEKELSAFIRAVDRGSSSKQPAVQTPDFVLRKVLSGQISMHFNSFFVVEN